MSAWMHQQQDMGAEAALRMAMGQDGRALMARALAGDMTGPWTGGTQVPGMGGNPPFPFTGPPTGAQGAYPGAFVSPSWNRHWETGQGAYGWKFDPDKEIPYYPLQNSSARHLMNMGVAPLRVNKRFANSLLWTIYSAKMSAMDWVAGKVGGWKKERNRREADTLARVLDLAVIELGVDLVEKSAGFEVMIRRLHAVSLADTMGNWNMACLMEELPSERSPHFHEVITRDLVKMSQLVDQASGKINMPDNSDA